MAPRRYAMLNEKVFWKSKEFGLILRLFFTEKRLMLSR